MDPLREPGRRVLFVVAPAEFSPSTTVRVRQYFDRLRAMGIQPHEMPYTSPTRERWYQQLIPGDRRIRNGAVRHAARVVLKAFNLAYSGWRQVQLAVVARRYDAIYVQYVLPPRWLVRLLAWRGTRLVYDFDDAVFLRHPARARAIVSAAWRVIPGSHFNLEFALRHNARSRLVPSAVPVELYSPDPAPARAGEPVRIGWIGSPSTLGYLDAVAAPLRRIHARGVPIELIVAGARDRTDLLPDVGDVPIRCIPSYTAADLPAIVRSLDIGLMPLTDGPWERGKCAMKALVYLAGARAAVCSPVGETLYVI